MHIDKYLNRMYYNFKITYLSKLGILEKWIIIDTICCLNLSVLKIKYIKMSRYVILKFQLVSIFSTSKYPINHLKLCMCTHT